MKITLVKYEYPNGKNWIPKSPYQNQHKRVILVGERSFYRIQTVSVRTSAAAPPFKIKFGCL